MGRSWSLGAGWTDRTEQVTSAFVQQEILGLWWSITAAWWVFVPLVALAFVTHWVLQRVM